jgi:F420-non-reducing hydrogenase large subunit
MAAGKAADAVYNVVPPPAAKKIRELFYMAHYVHSHIAHFYALAAPDFVVGPDADPAERNILGVIGRVGIEIGTEVIKQRRLAQEIQAMLAGHQTHVMLNLPGGVRKGLTEEQRADVEKRAEGFVEFARFTLKIFNDVVLGNSGYVDLILNGPYSLRLHSMGLVDDQNRVNFYDGKVRVVDQDGNELCKYAPSEYTEYVAEHVEPWTYLKFPYLRKIGWKGFEEGPDSGVYQATPLARFNVADGMATPLAQEEFERMRSTLGGKPVHATLCMHWARLVELLYAAEHLLELARDPEITSPELRTRIENTAGEGVGIVEAQRGTLTHHYQCDERGIITHANLIVGTTNNHAAISMSLKKAARDVIGKGRETTSGVLNRIEMAFRAYDPCFSCATHSLPGSMPLQVVVRDSRGNILQSTTR